MGLKLAIKILTLSIVALTTAYGQALPIELIGPDKSSNALISNFDYQEFGLTDFDLNGNSIISTIIHNADSLKLANETVVRPLEHSGAFTLTVSSYYAPNRQVEWHKLISAGQIYRARTALVNEDVIIALSFSGKLSFQDKQITAKEAIDALCIQMDSKGKIKQYFQVPGMQFSEFEANSEACFFSGGYRHELILDGKKYRGHMGQEIYYAGFLTAYDRTGRQKWVKILSNPADGHDMPWEFLTDFDILGVNSSYLNVRYVLSQNYLESSDGERLEVKNGCGVNNCVGLTNYLFKCSVGTGKIKSWGAYYTNNIMGQNFVHDPGSGSILTLIGNDSLLNSRIKTTNNLPYKSLFVNNMEVVRGFKDKYYGLLLFDSTGLRHKTTELDFGRKMLIDANIDKASFKYLYTNQAFSDDSSNFSTLTVGDSLPYSYLMQVDDHSVELLLRVERQFRLNNIHNSPIYVENDSLCAYFSKFATIDSFKFHYKIHFYSKGLIAKRKEFTFIPNAFSPNRDGINDSLELGKQPYEKAYWKIFGSNGQLLYEGDRPWDGKVNGTIVPDDAVYYLLEILHENGERKSYNGVISILR